MTANKFTLPGKRIAVVGVTGSGKTTMAGNLARALDISHIELDALHWGAGWTEVPWDVFRNELVKALKSPGWVTDGNYSQVRDIIWKEADTIVWLDYSFFTCLWRLTRRTVRRVASKEELWNSNRESFRIQFLSKDSLFLWQINTYPRRRREYSLLLAQPEFSHLKLIRLRTPRQADAWLASIDAARAPSGRFDSLILPE